MNWFSDDIKNIFKSFFLLRNLYNIRKDDIKQAKKIANKVYTIKLIWTQAAWTVINRVANRNNFKKIYGAISSDEYNTNFVTSLNILQCKFHPMHTKQFKRSKVERASCESLSKEVLNDEVIKVVKNFNIPFVEIFLVWLII